MSFKDRFREVEDIYSYVDDEEGFTQFIKKGYVPKKKFKTKDRTFRPNIVYKIPTDEKVLKEIEEEEGDIEEYTSEIGYLFEIDIGKNTYNIATREDEMLESDVEAITKDVEYYGIKGLAKALISKEYVSSEERERRERERVIRQEKKQKVVEEEDDDDDDEEYEEIMRGLTRAGDDDEDDDDEEPQVITKEEEPQPEPRVAKPTERRVAFAQQLWIDPPKVLTETEKSLKTEIEKAYEAAGDDEDEDEEESAYTKALMSATMAEPEEPEEAEPEEEEEGDLTEADGVNIELIPFDRKIFIRLGDDTTAYDAEGNKLGMLLEVSGELGDYYQAFVSNDVLKYLEEGVPVSRDVGTPSTIVLPEKIVEAPKPAPVQIRSIPVAPLAPTRAQPMEEQAINKTPNKVEGYTITRISNLSKTELVDLFGQIFGTNKYDSRFATQLSVPTLQHVIRKSQGMSFDATKIK